MDQGARETGKRHATHCEKGGKAGQGLQLCCCLRLYFLLAHMYLAQPSKGAPVVAVEAACMQPALMRSSAQLEGCNHGPLCYACTGRESMWNSNINLVLINVSNDVSWMEWTWKEVDTKNSGPHRPKYTDHCLCHASRVLACSSLAWPW